MTFSTQLGGSRVRTPFPHFQVEMECGDGNHVESATEVVAETSPIPLPTCELKSSAFFIVFVSKHFFKMYFLFRSVLPMTPMLTFKPFSQTPSPNAVNAYWPTFPEHIRTAVTGPPIKQVVVRGYQFPYYVEIDGLFYGEFNRSGCGPVDIRTNELYSGVDGLMSVDESLDVSLTHHRIETNYAWIYLVMVPAWLAVKVSDTERVFFKFCRHLPGSSTCLDISQVKTRIQLKFAFGFADSAHSLLNSRACIVATIDHFMPTDEWTLKMHIVA